ncbi:hypothetical protein Golob_019572, partial [Gossypium lobatum]|nr:hypothetical protein [Gossypium lobatum]
MINGIDIVTAQSYIIVLWSVLLHRNLFIWKGTAASPTHKIQRADNFLQHWVERMEGAPNVVNDFRASWSRPEQGFLKCNVDAATFSNAGCTSFTTVLRDHDALRWLREQHLDNLIVEPDCLLGMKALQ